MKDYKRLYNLYYCGLLSTEDGKRYWVEDERCWFVPIDSERYCLEWKNGDKEWYLNGQIHREDGPAVEYANGTKWWYLNDYFHREDGPAIEWVNGDKEWYLDDQRHREDGPAVECANGIKEWWLNGKELTEEEVNERVKNE